MTTKVHYHRFFHHKRIAHDLEGGDAMRLRRSIFMLLGISLLTAFQRLPANELQRLVFNAAGNIGMAEAIVEFQGITPENSSTLNGYINTAIAMLDQLAGQYNNPPFDAGQIRKIADMLRRFPLATERMNNRGKSTSFLDPTEA